MCFLGLAGQQSLDLTGQLSDPLVCQLGFLRLLFLEKDSELGRLSHSHLLENNCQS